VDDADLEAGGSGVGNVGAGLGANAPLDQAARDCTEDDQDDDRRERREQEGEPAVIERQGVRDFLGAVDLVALRAGPLSREEVREDANAENYCGKPACGQLCLVCNVLGPCAASSRGAGPRSLVCPKAGRRGP